ncbi:Rab GTPase activating protein [Entamoeba marina]
MQKLSTTQLDAFKKYFIDDDSFSHLRSTGIDFGYDTLNIRSIAWRVFLDTLHGKCSANWINEIKQQRDRYEILLQKLENGPIREENLHNLTTSQELSCDPLSIDSDNPWCQHFEEIDVEKRVGVDIQRLFSEYDYFRNENVREHIKRVCVIYSLEHTDLKYNQGFHELVGVFYFALSQDVSKWKQTNDVMVELMQDQEQKEKHQEIYNVLSCILDEQYLEHDAFYLFETLMNSVRDFYDPSETRDTTIESPDGSSTHTRLMVKCDQLSKQLEKLDNQLYLHLKYDGIHLVLFGTRWLRLLFDREFHVMDVLNVWDALFAYGNNLKFVDYMFLAMMLQIREPILESSQYSTTMMLFMKYPDITDIHDVINLAKELSEANEDFTPMPYIQPLTPQLLSAKVSDLGSKMKKKNRLGLTKKKEKEYEKKVDNVNAPQVDDTSDSQPKDNVDASELINARISHCIQLLGGSINNEGVVSDPNSVVEALSELKLVNAVLKGLLPVELADDYFDVFGKKE